MNPTQKHSEIEAKLAQAIGQDRRVAILANLCQPPPIGCGGVATNFRDQESQDEYRISGLCQECQDHIWGPAPAK